MIDPPITSLMKNVNSRYTLVIETAKRARQISEGDAPLVWTDSKKPVSIAVNEIYDGKIGYLEAFKR